MAESPKRRRTRAPTAAREPPPRSVVWRKRAWTFIRSGWGAIPILATLIGVGFTLRHEFDSQPASRAAALSNLTLDRNVDFGQYLDRIKSPRTPYTSAQLGRKGVYLEFDISVTGYHGKSLPLRWILLDQDTNNLIDQGEALRIRPRAEQDSGTWFSWVPVPPGGHSYVVRLSLYDDQVPPRPLARLDSDSFQLSA
jgi:hypothetical protein